MKKNKNSKNTGLGSGLSSLLGNEFEKKQFFQIAVLMINLKWCLSNL